MLASVAVLLAGAASVSAQTFPAGVLATGTMGTTNPPQPTAPTSINQTSYSRLLSINSIDDFCFFAPPQVSAIADSETEEVAWCTQPRNDARVIPDGTFTGINFLKNDFYVQVIAYGDFTRLNIPSGDSGGELDPHGATGAGNPVGGNVTTNINGKDYNIAEWMQFISYNQLCIRACINANSTYDAAHMCWHELDEMGCEFNMPGNYDVNGTFETCDADVAYPPGWYPVVQGGTTSFSTFAQYWSGVVNGQTYTLGDTITPSTVAFTPSSSNCQPTATISNGIALASLGVTGAASGAGAGTTGTGSNAASSSATAGSGSRSASTTGAKATGTNAARALTVGGDRAFHEGIVLTSLIAGIAAIIMFH